MQFKALFLSTLLLVASISSAATVTTVSSIPDPNIDKSEPTADSSSVSPTSSSNGPRYAVFSKSNLVYSGIAKQSSQDETLPPKKRGLACSIPISRGFELTIHCSGPSYNVWVNCTDGYRYTTSDPLMNLRRIVMTCPKGSDATNGGAYLIQAS
ncbi:hypothetical protein BGZ65_004858 [Modicella reniformis]|uniref:Cyanovirin-N domain-containing protein n=1 Tax=Modicella reniformis TaxID=1440133 RepID=A0A9P6IRB2_9FUNG|nr:hypothetical protein BGZ65_004858 [Modicella reniformis]